MVVCITEDIVGILLIKNPNFWLIPESGFTPLRQSYCLVSVTAFVIIVVGVIAIVTTRRHQRMRSNFIKKVASVLSQNDSTRESLLYPVIDLSQDSGHGNTSQPEYNGEF